MNCPKHPGVKLICPACAGEHGGQVGGRARTRAKKKSSRANGKLGGRPKLPPHNLALHAAAADARFKKRLANCEGCNARKRKS